MKRRDTLMRLKRFRVDEFKRRLATLDDMKADLDKKLKDLDDSVVREKQKAADSEIGRVAFPTFLQSIDVRRKNIQATTKDLERERDAVQEDLTSAYQDLKTFELAEQERERRVEEQLERAAQSRMDEIAITRHLRKHAVRQA